MAGRSPPFKERAPQAVFVATGVEAARRLVGDLALRHMDMLEAEEIHGPTTPVLSLIELELARSIRNRTEPMADLAQRLVNHVKPG
jgi:hypothetical protein